MDMIEVLCRFQPLSEEERRELAGIIIERKYPKGHHLLNLWQTCHYFHYIVRGAGRVYYLRDGLDISDYFALDGNFIGGVESLFTKEPSHKAIELLEPSVVQSLVYSEFVRLSETYHRIETMGRKMAVFAFLDVQRRLEDMRFKSAAERYQDLESKYPGISNRIPLKHLASFLGITQVSLSRIRSGIQ